MKVTFTNALIPSYHIAGTSPQIPEDHLTITFGRTAFSTGSASATVNASPGI